MALVAGTTTEIALLRRAMEYEENGGQITYTLRVYDPGGLTEKQVAARIDTAYGYRIGPTAASYQTERITRIAIQQEFEEEATSYIVTVTMEFDYVDFATSLPPKIRFGYNSYLTTLSKAWTDTGSQQGYLEEFVNAVGDPLDPPLQKEQKLQTITIEQFLKTFDPKWQTEYADSVNSLKIKVAGIDIAPETARILSIEIEPRKYIDTANSRAENYWWTMVALEINPDGYTEIRKNRGYNYLDVLTGEKKAVTMTDANGNTITPTEPQNLLANGALADADEDASDLEFYRFPLKDWKNLQLPAEHPFIAET